MSDAPHLDGAGTPPPPGAPGGGGLVPILERVVVFQDGAPVVLAVPKFTPAQINEVGEAVLAEPYDGPEPALKGRPLLEVMLLKQAREAARTGDSNIIEDILDRRLGKPKSTVESHSVSESYEQFLSRKAKEASEKPAPPSPILRGEVVRDDADSSLEGL